MRATGASVKDPFYEDARTPEERTVTNWRAWVFGTVLSALLAAVLWLPFSLWQPFEIRPIQGALQLDQSSVCQLMGDRCEDVRQIDLPHLGGRYNQSEPVTNRYEVTFEGMAVNSGVQAIYIPKVADTFAITLNGQALTDPASLDRTRWFQPTLVPLPENIIRSDLNRLQIDVLAYGQTGTQLYPISIGPYSALRPAYDHRYWMSRGVAQLGFFLVLTVTGVLIVIVIIRPQDRQVLWLSLSGALIALMASYFAFDETWLPYRFSVMRFIFSLQLFIFFTIKFFAAFLRIRVAWLEWSYIAWLTLSLIGNLVGPDSHVMTIAVWFTIGNFIWTYLGLAMIWVHRHLLTPPTFWTFFLTYVAASITGAHDFQFFMPNMPISTLPLLHWLPLFAAIGGLILVVTQLLAAIRQSEDFNRVLRKRVEDKTQELEASYALLTETQKRSAIDQERTRIMLDLHDGVGGQLVNMLAYMQNNDIQDDTLKDALDDALTDLGLMIDSFQTQDSVTTLIGMFRSRIEPLLARHGLRFEWAIGDEPITPKSGASENLTLLRIVQEAVTNAVKHSGADIIAVRTDKRSVTINDNGHGFDLSEVRSEQKGHGVGLISMRHRAKDIGAELEMKSDKNGTTVKLIWPEF